MVFASLFAALSQNYFPSHFVVASWAEVPMLFQTFAFGFGAMAMIMFLLFSRAAKLGETLGFSATEIKYAHFKRLMWGMAVVFSILSLLLAAIIPARPEMGLWVGMPGFIFFGLNITHVLIRRHYRKLNIL